MAGMVPRRIKNIMRNLIIAFTFLIGAGSAFHPAISQPISYTILICFVLSALAVVGAQTGPNRRRVSLWCPVFALLGAGGAIAITEVWEAPWPAGAILCVMGAFCGLSVIGGQKRWGSQLFGGLN